MKEMRNKEEFTDKEFEELAAILSGEEKENPDLMSMFLNKDYQNTVEKWKMMKNNNDLKEIDVEKAWGSVSSRLEKADLERVEIRKLTLTRTLFRAAAVILFIVSFGSGGYYIYLNKPFSGQITLSTGADQKNLLVDLSDGSKIYLNRNSQHSYSRKFGKGNRNVRLQGEAFFDISPDASKPFTIDAGDAIIRVVGTTFNVITGDRHSGVEVYVKTGRVILEDQNNSRSIELDPGFIWKIDDNGTNKTMNDDPNYLSWNTGLLVYDGQKLETVFRDLKRVYNMNITADDRSILEYQWTSPIDNLKEDTIMQLICVSFNLSYSKDGNMYHLKQK